MLRGSRSSCADHGVARAAAFDAITRALESDARPVPIFDVQCAAELPEDADGPAVASESLTDRLASAEARPVPIDALQCGALGWPAAETAIVWLLLETWPVPMVAVQSCA
jgi:hypothetical protein